jgi:hypothetical protein
MLKRSLRETACYPLGAPMLTLLVLADPVGDVREIAFRRPSLADVNVCGQLVSYQLDAETQEYRPHMNAEAVIVMSAC